MDQLTPDQMDALNNLMEQLALAEDTVVDNIRRSPRLANKERVDYADLNAKGTTYKGGKKKRKMRGGGVCTEGTKKWAYNLAIDSVLVMAGAAGTTAGVFAGWTVLSAFITAFGLGAPFLAIIAAVYDILRVISIHLVLNIPLAAWTAFRTTATFSAGFAYDSIMEILRSSDVLIDTALFRYILTENDAITDINKILETLKENYTTLSNKVGVFTRSAQEKIDALRVQIDRLTAMAAAQMARASVSTQSATNTYGNIKQAICRAIDNGISDVCLINEIMQVYGFSQIQTDGGCTISGGRRRRKSKRSTRKGKRSTKRTKKNSRRSSRRK